jgi:hypothetical protein
MRKYTYLLLALLLFTNIGKMQAGGGWVYGKNKGYVKIAQNVIRSAYFFDGTGEVIDIPTISLYTTSIYAEYGLTDKLTAIVYLPFFVRSTLNEIEFQQSGNTIEGDDVSSFGDTNIGFKFGLFQNKSVVVAASLTFGLPLGSSEVSSESVLQTGDGEFNQLLKVEASHSFYPKPYYATAFVGFNNRTQGFSDEFHAGGEFGITLNKFVAIIKAYNVSSLYNGNAGENGANGVFANNTEYFSFTPELVYQFSEKAGMAASSGLAFSGRRILAAPNFSLGFYMNL